MKLARLGLVLLVMSGVAILACVLADPPVIEQPPPASRPLIIHDSVTPRLDQKLLAPPNAAAGIAFDVPVLADPTTKLAWAVFEDLDTTAPNAPILHSLPDDAGLQGLPIIDGGEAIRNIGFSLLASNGVDFSGCHKITFIVGTGFNSNASTQPLDPPGGDSVTWWYEPVSDCSFYDAAPPTDAAASDGADE